MRGRSGGDGQLAKDFRIVARHVANEGEVQIFAEVAVLAAIFRARGLVFVIVIFKRFGETYGRQAGLDKRNVIAAAAQAVEAENQAHGIAAGDFFDGQRQLARRRVDAFRAAAGKNTDAVRRARRGVGSHDVVIQETADLVALLLQVGEKASAAEQALFFARDGGKQQRGAVGAARKQARRGESHRDAGGIVIGAGRVHLRIHHVGSARIEVAGDEKNRFSEQRIAAGKNGDDIFKMRGLITGARRSRLEFIDGNLEAAAGVFGDLLVAREDAIARAADAAVGIVPGGERQARSAGDELFVDRAKVRQIDGVGRNCAGGAGKDVCSRLARRRLRGILGEEGSGEGEKGEKCSGSGRAQELVRGGMCLATCWFRCGHDGWPV